MKVSPLGRNAIVEMVTGTVVFLATLAALPPVAYWVLKKWYDEAEGVSR